MSNNAYLTKLINCLPKELSLSLKSLCAQSESNQRTLESVVGFICGGERPSEFDANSWTIGQESLRNALSTLSPGTKRLRDDAAEESANKKRRVEVDEAGAVQFTLHSISVTSPVRKKVDITIHSDAVAFTNPTTHTVESTIPISLLRRAFILPTRGKSKPHWTVVILSTDTLPAKGSSSSPQIIFGLDATASAPLTTTDHASSDVNTTKKGTETLPAIKKLLFHLPSVVLHEPNTDVFKSARSDCPGIEAYLGAKAGTLWFFDEGVLWGETKPCEFWAVENLLGKGGDAVRLVSATGRMCSMFLTRGPEEVGDEEGEGEAIGEETQFAMIDGKEQDAINQWVRKRRHMFGRAGGRVTGDVEMEPVKKVSSGPKTIMQLDDGSDGSDEDFENSGSDDGGSTSGSSDSNDSEEEDDADDADTDGEAEDEENYTLDQKHHPLLREGAMPRMSKAAMEMAVGIVQSDMLGMSDADGDGDDDEEDQLED